MSTANPTNVAQKVRLWFMLGLSIVQAIALIYIGTIPAYQLAMGNGSGAYGWLLITFVANIVLGSISLFRFLHPIARHAQPLVGYPLVPPASYGHYPPQPPAAQYPPPAAQPGNPYGSYLP